MQVREIVPRTGNFAVFVAGAGENSRALFAERDYAEGGRPSREFTGQVVLWCVQKTSCERRRAKAEELRQFPFLGDITGYGVNAFHAQGANPGEIRDFVRIYGALAPRASVFGFFWRLLVRK